MTSLQAAVIFRLLEGCFENDLAMLWRSLNECLWYQLILYMAVFWLYAMLPCWCPNLEEPQECRGNPLFLRQKCSKHTSPCQHAEDFLSATMAIASRATAFLCRWMSRRERHDIRERKEAWRLLLLGLKPEIAGGPKELGMMHFPYMFKKIGNSRFAENRSCRFI